VGVDSCMPPFTAQKNIGDMKMIGVQHVLCFVVAIPLSTVLSVEGRFNAIAICSLVLLLSAAVIHIALNIRAYRFEAELEESTGARLVDPLEEFLRPGVGMMVFAGAFFGAFWLTAVIVKAFFLLLENFSDFSLLEKLSYFIWDTDYGLAVVIFVTIAVIVALALAILGKNARIIYD